eukprot:CAMPEP_0206307642 /NCGR_PEP_ID=MMETSP0106_2-20121207/11439_1 /ASSEMBLY_ACC=CAM_ASM_000206 /TAXON_ID=81532 /ORGANISM="Acanthoeca-like sp., Strain 10tr" /LENGTH=156 /DNA_ID=CAMNT_0053738637 /DNA_START=710 /DNA_END=1180 /DNA_ORIENTATION=-
MVPDSFTSAGLELYDLAICGRRTSSQLSTVPIILNRPWKFDPFVAPSRHQSLNSWYAPGAFSMSRRYSAVSSVISATNTTWMHGPSVGGRINWHDCGNTSVIIKREGTSGSGDITVGTGRSISGPIGLTIESHLYQSRETSLNIAESDGAFFPCFL